MFPQTEGTVPVQSSGWPAVLSLVKPISTLFQRKLRLRDDGMISNGGYSSRALFCHWHWTI